MALRAQLAVLVVAAALAGCGGGQGDSAGSKSATGAAADGLPTRSMSGRARGATDRVPQEVTRACRRAAARVDIGVLCPKIVPQGDIERALGFGAITVPGERRYYELTFNNASGRHWVVGRGGRRQVAKFVFGSAWRARVLRRDRIDGRVTSTYAFKGYPVGGLHGDHVAIFTKYRETIVFASVHGREHRGVALSVLRSMLPTS